MKTIGRKTKCAIFWTFISEFQRGMFCQVEFELLIVIRVVSWYGIYLLKIRSNGQDALLQADRMVSLCKLSFISKICTESKTIRQAFATREVIRQYTMDVRNQSHVI